MQETERSESQASRTTSRPDWLNLNVLIKKEKKKKNNDKQTESQIYEIFSHTNSIQGQLGLRVYSPNIQPIQTWSSL